MNDEQGRSCVRSVGLNREERPSYPHVHDPLGQIRKQRRNMNPKYRTGDRCQISESTSGSCCLYLLFLDRQMFEERESNE